VSAGSHPTGYVHPRSLALLAREGIDTPGAHSKSWDNLLVAPDIVISVCASAAGEACPVYLAPAIRAHWGVDDPAHATGTEPEIDAAFLRAYRLLRGCIEQFLAQDLDTLAQQPEALKTALDRIAGRLPA
jgi:arsenate reductase